MPGLLDSHEIEIPCAKCGRETKKSIGWIKSHSEFTCTCGERIALNTNQFKSEIAKVERSLSKFQSTLKGLSKK